jgi:hypothetical protein
MSGLTTFTLHTASREWRIETRRDGRPLVSLWPGVYLRLSQGKPELVVPPVEES